MLTVVARLADPCKHTVSTGVQRGRIADIPRLNGAAVNNGITVGHLSIQITRPVCQGRCAWRLTVSIARHADLAILLSLVDPDRCGAGCFRIGIPILRRELPSDIMAQRTRIQNRIARLLPREGALNDRIADLHRTGDLDLAQRLTVGEFGRRERRCTGQNRGEPVLRADIDGQGDILIVARGDCNSNRAELSFVRAASVCFQRQLTGLAVYKGNIGTLAQSGINLLVIDDLAVVAGSSQLRQQRREAKGISLVQTVGDGQRASLCCGCSSLGDLEGLDGLAENIVAAFNVLDGHSRSTGIGIVAVENLVLLRVDDVAGVVLDGDGRFQSIAGVGAGCNFNRGRHFFWRDLPLDRGLTGVVAGTFDGQGNAVIGIGGLVAAFDNIGDSCFIPVLQRHAGNLRRLLRCIVRKFVFFQRDGCALDGLGGDVDFHYVGYGCVFLVAFRRGEYPIDVAIAGSAGYIVFIQPRKGALDFFSCGRVFHRALDREPAVFQCLAVGDARRADFEVI